MNRGDVVRVELPRPRGSTGHEQFGRRPAIVLQNQREFRSLSTVVVVPLTSNESALRFAGTFLVEPTQANGLSVQSVALVHQIRAIDESRIESTIGSLAWDDLQRLEGLLRRLLSL